MENKYRQTNKLLSSITCLQLPPLLLLLPCATPPALMLAVLQPKSLRSNHISFSPSPQDFPLLIHLLVRLITRPHKSWYHDEIPCRKGEKWGKNEWENNRRWCRVKVVKSISIGSYRRINMRLSKILLDIITGLGLGISGAQRRGKEKGWRRRWVEAVKRCGRILDCKEIATDLSAFKRRVKKADWSGAETYLFEFFIFNFALLLLLLVCLPTCASTCD